MQCEWLGERVATVDVDRALNNVIHNKEDAGWGPNAVFRFPLEGGTGGIWKGVSKLLPQDKQVSRKQCLSCSRNLVWHVICYDLCGAQLHCQLMHIPVFIRVVFTEDRKLCHCVWKQDRAFLFVL